jgi:hypothetical protein
VGFGLVYSIYGDRRRLLPILEKFLVCIGSGSTFSIEDSARGFNFDSFESRPVSTYSLR